MKIKTNVKAGNGTGDPAPKKITTNHNQNVVRGLKVKSGVIASVTCEMHSEQITPKIY